MQSYFFALWRNPDGFREDQIERARELVLACPDAVANRCEARAEQVQVMLRPSQGAAELLAKLAEGLG